MKYVDYFRFGKDPVKKSLAAVKGGISKVFKFFSPSNMKHIIMEFQQKTPLEQIACFFKLFFYLFYYSGYGIGSVIK